MFFEKKGPVWETLRSLEIRLTEANIDYVIIGGLALNSHNYPRQTVDVDVVLTEEGFQEFTRLHEGSDYVQGPGTPRRFVDARTEVAIDVLIAGQLAGNRSKNSTIRFPDPTEVEIHEGLRTVSLARLIELKLVTWRFKDWGDVVELIRRNGLGEDFAEQLNQIVRSAYGECYDQATSPGYEEPV